MESSRGGLSLATSDVPDKDDLEVFTTLSKSEIDQKAPETELRVEIPTSKSCLKICDFPYYGLTPKHDEKTGKLIPLTVDQVAKILDTSPFAKDFRYYENSLPRLSKNAGNSDTCMIWLDIADSRAGLNLRNLVGRSFMYGCHRLVLAPAERRTGVPQCDRCWRFRHKGNARVCPLKAKLCPLCGEPHTLALHRALALCCRGKPKHNPPIPPTPEGQDCSHDARCVNCGEKHASDDRTCKYWQKRFDGGWIFHCYKEQKVSDSFTKFFSSSNVLPAGQHDRRIPQRLP